MLDEHLHPFPSHPIRKSAVWEEKSSSRAATDGSRNREHEVSGSQSNIILSVGTESWSMHTHTSASMMSVAFAAIVINKML